MDRYTTYDFSVYSVITFDPSYPLHRVITFTPDSGSLHLLNNSRGVTYPQSRSGPGAEESDIGTVLEWNNKFTRPIFLGYPVLRFCPDSHSFLQKNVGTKSGTLLTSDTQCLSDIGSEPKVPFTEVQTVVQSSGLSHYPVPLHRVPVDSSLWSWNSGQGLPVSESPDDSGVLFSEVRVRSGVETPTPLADVRSTRPTSNWKQSRSKSRGG